MDTRRAPDAPHGSPRLLAILLSLLTGCALFTDDLTGPVAPSISNLTVTPRSFGANNFMCYELGVRYRDADGDVPFDPTVRFQTLFNTGEFYDQTWAGSSTGSGAEGSIEAIICHQVSVERTSLDQDVSVFDADGNESNVLSASISLPPPP